MRIATCVGYHATGSGVVDDLLREFDNVAQGAYEAECRLLQDPDGIADLEYNLVTNPHRLNSGFAIKRYLRFVHENRRTYRKIFGPNWEPISVEYAESLAKFSFSGYWHADLRLVNRPAYYMYLMRRGIAKILPKGIAKPAYYNYFPNLSSYHVYIDSNDFLEKTKDYIDRLCAEVHDDGIDFIMLDQLVATDNPGRYIKYVNNIKVIIVDRDPRDLYIHCRLHGDHVLPVEVEEFCQSYKDSRQHRADMEVFGDSVLELNFEDLIYRYDASVDTLISFLGESEEHHVAPRTRFNPDVSIKNTKQWLTHPEYNEQVRTIEKLIPEYLHEY